MQTVLAKEITPLELKLRLRKAVSEPSLLDQSFWSPTQHCLIGATLFLPCCSSQLAFFHGLPKSTEGDNGYVFARSISLEELSTSR
jgi:hypothetical protein